MTPAGPGRAPETAARRPAHRHLSPGGATDLVIETHELRKQFGAKTAVADLRLAVGRGEVFGFLGPNGAGKTTALKMLLGLVRPTAGTGRVLGRPLGDTRARARIGFLPEHFRFQDWLTGRELLRFHGRLFGLRGLRLEARIDALLDRVDLLDAAERQVRHYSKGMLQRVGLAQAMLHRPELIFLDEPTSGLDPLGRRLVRGLIAELREAGTTVFLNSHLLGEVEVTCDRVAFVKQGWVVREKALAEAEEELDVEIEVRPLDPELRLGVSRFGREVARGESWMRLRVAGEEVLPELACFVVERGARLYRLQARRRSLEALFVEVMGADQRPG